MAAILEVLPDGLLGYDSSGSVSLANAAAHRLLGLPPRQRLVGLTHHELLDLLRARLVDEPQAAAALEPPAVDSGSEAELELTHPRQWLHLLHCRLPRSRGHRLALLIVLQDWTPVREEQETRRERLHMFAHEVRTPLTNVKAYTQLAQRQLRCLTGSHRAEAEGAAVLERSLGYLETVERQADRLSRLALSLSESHS